MKLFLALLLNALVLAALGWWLRREYCRSGPELRRWLLPALALRVVAGMLQNSPDAQHMSYWARGLTMQIWAQPDAAWVVWQGHVVRVGQQMLYIYEWSNTLFIIRLLALLNMASLGSPLLNGLYLTLACYAACWGLVRVLGRLFPAAPVGAAVVAFLLWPSAVWWSAGTNKETLVLGSGAVLVTLVLSALYSPVVWPRWQRLGGWLLLALLAWLHVRLRYFFALPLLGSLLALASTTLALRRGWLRASWLPLALAMLGAVVAAGAAAVAVGGEPVSKAFVTSQLWDSYVHGIATSAERPHIEYSGLHPTVSSMVSHFPLAAAQTLVRPWLGESAALRYVGVGLENLSLLGLLTTAVVAVVRGRPGRLPPALVLALLLYCVVLAGLIGLSTPNLGTLLRYRTVLLPWLLWLLLQNDYARRLLRRVGLGS